MSRFFQVHPILWLIGHVGGLPNVSNDFSRLGRFSLIHLCILIHIHPIIHPLADGFRVALTRIWVRGWSSSLEFLLSPLINWLPDLLSRFPTFFTFRLMTFRLDKICNKNACVRLYGSLDNFRGLLSRFWWNSRALTILWRDYVTLHLIFHLPKQWALRPKFKF